MKKLIFPMLLTAGSPLFAGVEAPVMAPPAPDCTAGFTLGLEALYLKAYQSEGRYDDSDYEFGGRGSIGYDFNDCLFIKATYFGYSADVAHEEDRGIVSFDEYDADMDASYFDLVVGQHFKPSEKLTLSPYVGLRWASFEESDRRYSEDSLIFTTSTTAKSSADFSGIGAVVGIDGVREFGSGFSLYGTAKQSVVFGETDHSFDIKSSGTINRTSLDLGEDDDSDDRVLFITELGLGVQYGFNFASVAANVRLGVEGQWWSGLSNDDSENAGLAGFVLGGNFKF